MLRSEIVVLIQEVAWMKTNHGSIRRLDLERLTVDREVTESDTASSEKGI